MSKTQWAERLQTFGLTSPDHAPANIQKKRGNDKISWKKPSFQKKVRAFTCYFYGSADYERGFPLITWRQNYAVHREKCIIRTPSTSSRGTLLIPRGLKTQSPKVTALQVMAKRCKNKYWRTCETNESPLKKSVGIGGKI